MMNRPSSTGYRWQLFHRLGSFPFVYRWAGLFLPYFRFLALILIGVGVTWGLFFAPADYQQGDAFRIIYVHVPAAFFSLALYGAMGIASIGYLIWRIKLWDCLALAIAPVGAVFALIALITGSIWGKPMWGTYWIWDARLTSELILFFLYVGYLALAHQLKGHPEGPKIVAVLAMVGLLDLPIIHYSVTWWQTLHQGSTLVKLKPSIDAAMLYPLILVGLGFAAYAGWIVMLRLRHLIAERALETAWLKDLQS